MARRASVAEARASRNRVRDITDIMQPTTGVIEFSPADAASNPLLRHTFLQPIDTSFSPESSSSSESPLTGFPITPICSESSDAWNLVPYHISWGHEYQEYRAGRLPGPEGDCIFLRSPTPLKNQRTTEACKKCRERKAKCSGGRPACGRCAARGFACEYASAGAEIEVSSVAKSRRARRGTTASLAWTDSQAASPLSPSEDSVSASPAEMPKVPEIFLNANLKDDILPLLVPTDIYWDASSPADGFLSSPKPWSMPYSASPIDSNDFNPADIYDSTNALVFPPEDMFASLPASHSSIFAPQPMRRPSLMSIESSDSSSLQSDLGLDGLTIDQVPFADLSPAGSCFSSPAPDCFDPYGTQSMYLNPHVEQYLRSTHDQSPLDDPWLVSPDAPHDLFSDSQLGFGAAAPDFVAF